MKNLDLNVYGVQEMNAVEMKKTNGGIAWGLVLAIAGAAIYVYNNADDFVDGVKEGYEDQQSL